MGKRKKIKRAPKNLPAVVVEPKQPATRVLMAATSKNNIRNWRLFRGIKNHGALAKLTEGVDGGIAMTRATICRLESGKLRYREDQLDVLAVVLKCTPTDLIGTDPFNAGDIFTIYRRLTGHAKDAVDDLVRKLDPVK